MRSKDHVLQDLAREEIALASLERSTNETRTRIDALRAELASVATAWRPPIERSIAVREAPTWTDEQRVQMFRSLFRGRPDVYPLRFVSRKTGKPGYAPECSNKWAPGICLLKQGGKCAECASQMFTPVSDEALIRHFEGEHIMGVYPLLEDETCAFLAVDFDKGHWKEDVAAFADTCRSEGLPVAIERSRSGNGAHAWFFFTAPISANVARRMGCYLITQTMNRRHELSMQSYDRLFPNQDTLPRGGLGNLIALPLQWEPRQQGNSVFVDDRFAPLEDQWSFLASVRKVEPTQAETIAREATRTGRVIGVRCVEALDDEEIIAPWTRPPSGWEKFASVPGSLPATVLATLAQRLYIDKAGLPSALLNQLKRLAAFQNPEFYKKQRMRLSTALIPRVIACAEDLPNYISLPRGCRPEAEELLDMHRVTLSVDDQRIPGTSVAWEFSGDLTTLQAQAARALLSHETGVFVGPPGIGKTVLATFLIAQRACNTLILVHRKPLLEQWIAQLAMFLGLDEKEIGQIGGGKRKPNGRLDVATVQSLVRREKVDNLLAHYGHVVVDECHHVPASAFDRALSEVKGRYLLGLTATPLRRDGQHPITHMQLGPVRFKVDAKDQAAQRPFRHILIVRETEFKLPTDGAEARIQEIYRALASDQVRNRRIVNDVIAALQEGRSPIVLTERKDHLESFAAQLRGSVRHLVILQGGTSAKDRRRAKEQLASIPDTTERVILATGRYIGEGFDDARLDTLFLALPISWKGTLIQYSGRLHRRHPAKSEVRIYDYVDRNVPMLLRMFEKRLTTYRAIGYARGEAPLGFAEAPEEELTVEYDEEALRHFEQDF